ncbi:16S rRNA (cytosine(1402)-N(4))-methyltransferase RsmH [Rickettsiales bacterium LUAb2]
MDLNLLEIKKNHIHFPVLIREVLEYLDLSDNKVYVDCTFGGGNYTKLILEHSKAKVIAIDRDINVMKYVEPLKAKYGDRLQFFLNTFSNIDEVVKMAGLQQVDGIIADFGVSTMQITEKDRGFSFREDGPLLMQMGLNQQTAFDFVNYAKEDKIAYVLLEYGEEIKAQKIAKAIVNARNKQPINTTKELRAIINSVVGFSGKIDGSTRSFQAIRIYINDELNEIIKMLNLSLPLLKKQGKIITVSFHSLEDRIVKIFFNEISNKKKMEEFTIYKPNPAIVDYTFEVLTKKVVAPSRDEVRINRNSKSAKLRAIMKV